MLCLSGNGGARRILAGLGVLFIVLVVSSALLVLTNYKNLGNLVWVVRLVRANYLEEVEASTLINGAITGIVEALDDPYSVYLDPGTFKRLQEQIEQSFGGLGIAVGYGEDQSLTVRRVFENSPAEKEGLRENDVIIEVDGTSTEGMDLETAVTLMRGEVGSKVEVVVRRAGEDQPLRFILTRDTIHNPTVDSQVLEDGIGYLSIYQFGRNTGSEAVYALNALEQQGITSLILDLRGNPGGELFAAVDVADLFIEGGPIVHIDYRTAEDQILTANPSTLDLPLVVLVNGYTTSAAEIVAGALKDAGAGTLVGTKTYGKGVVQTVFPLVDGSGLKLTTARYLTPKGHDLNMQGVEPDIVVEQDAYGETDTQLEKAIALLKAGNV